MIDPGLEDQLVERLVAFAAARIGFSEQAIRPDAVRKVLREELRKDGSLDGLQRKLQDQDALLLGALRSAVLVGETYFFRQAEHFDFLTGTAIPRLAREVEGPLRAWSAGCSTGEEPYSLAACFLAARLQVAAQVVGTDISPASLQVARGGAYSRWSSRQSSPPLFPVHRLVSPDRLQVLGEVQALTRFVEHNLLEAARPGLGEFHVIFCRNVLAYFSAPGRAHRGRPPRGRAGPRRVRVLRRHGRGARAARPGGGALPRPPGLPQAAPRPRPRPRPTGPRARARARIRGRARGRGRRSSCTSARITQIERGHRAQAEQDLQELRRRAPRYLPGLLELSLLHLRNGRRGPAEELMREILRRAQGRADDEPCAGPEPLPVSYYRTAARALLAGPGGET